MRSFVFVKIVVRFSISRLVRGLVLSLSCIAEYSTVSSSHSFSDVLNSAGTNMLVIYFIHHTTIK